MSAVTAVPLRPIARGSVLKLWIGLTLLSLVALSVAWWGTRWMQPVTLDSGVRVQTIREGTGPVMTNADVIAMRFQIKVNSVDAPVFRDSGAQPFVGTVQDIPAGFTEGVQRMRAGGRYVVSVPVSVILAGQPLPPRADFAANDTLLFETDVLQIDPGQASAYQMQRLQQMMQQQQMQQGGAVPPGANPHAGPAMPPPGAGGAPQGAPPSPGGR
jgi:FKBP-type peptidyl-prolyl cis-trans isomerase FkpA